MKDVPKQTHPSYGKIAIHRVSGYGKPLFGSSIQHGQSIRITISTASLMRDLHNDRIHDKENIVEVEMSPVQFAEMLTGMNTTGVPCTVLQRGVETMPPCPYVDKKEMFRYEFKDKVSRIARCMDEMGAALAEFKAAKSIKKSDIERLTSLFATVRQDIVSNMPFAAECFDEHLERATLEAKGEVEAFMLHKALIMAEEGLKLVKQVGDQPDQPSIQLEADVAERKPGPDY